MTGKQDTNNSPRSAIEIALGAASDGASLLLFFAPPRAFQRNLHTAWLTASQILFGAGAAAAMDHIFDGDRNEVLAAVVIFFVASGILFAWSRMNQVTRVVSYAAGVLLGMGALTFVVCGISTFAKLIVSLWLMAAWITYVQRFLRADTD